MKADLQVGELEKLESDLKISEHAEEIKTQFNLIIDHNFPLDYFYKALNYCSN